MTSPETPSPETPSPETSSTLPGGFGRAFVETVRASLEGAADALGDLDRRAGDGDFGDNVRTAMKNLGRELEALEENVADRTGGAGAADGEGGEHAPDEYRRQVTALSRAWLGVGGTSGPLLGMFFRELASAGEQDATLTLARFAEALAAGQAVIQKYGEAEVGDKTMVDALDPAVAALHDAVEAGQDAGQDAGQGAAGTSGSPAAEALATAEQAAIDAAQQTAGTTARRGRASYVGDAAKGVIDPGAAAIALILGAARAAAEGGGEVAHDWIG